MDTVFRVAFSCMKSRTDADDITQNVLLKLYRYEGDFQDESHLKNWLIRVTINECKSAFRSLWRKTENLDDYVNSLAMPTEEHTELLEAVMGLPQKYRVVIYLFYYEGYSTAELARLLSLPEATVRTHLARGRRRLKSILTEADDDE
ncbi:MAG: sigma-70 family RNA polymerase sigma factor [Oscillospiraceae bacterium]|nr:sigma-70 family RNA polymerase sigma factor [Oscillospiraceae bacterium]